LPIYDKVNGRLRELTGLQSREQRLREREHKPIKKLVNCLETAQTACVSDLYFLFTMSKMKYRPRTVRCQRINNYYGFSLNCMDLGGHRQIIYFNEVNPGSPAEHAGIKKGDRLVDLNDEKIADHSFQEVKDLVKQSGDSITVLLSDPETDAYIQEKLELPVLKFQVQSNTNIGKIKEEWQKFRKKQKQRNIGFFYNFDKMQNKLNVIKPDRPPSPIIQIEEPHKIDNNIERHYTNQRDATDYNHQHYHNHGQQQEQQQQHYPADDPPLWSHHPPAHHQQQQNPHQNPAPPPQYNNPDPWGHAPVIMPNHHPDHQQQQRHGGFNPVRHHHNQYANQQQHHQPDRWGDGMNRRHHDDYDQFNNQYDHYDRQRYRPY